MNQEPFLRPIAKLLRIRRIRQIRLDYQSYQLKKLQEQAFLPFQLYRSLQPLFLNQTLKLLTFQISYYLPLGALVSLLAALTRALNLTIFIIKIRVVSALLTVRQQIRWVQYLVGVDLDGTYQFKYFYYSLVLVYLRSSRPILTYIQRLKKLANITNQDDMLVNNHGHRRRPLLAN